jgi:hypothetical protein
MIFVVAALLGLALAISWPVVEELLIALLE